MKLAVKVRDQVTAIVGYGPGDKGQPKAIVILDGGLVAVGLDEVQLLDLPPGLRRRIKRAVRGEVKVEP